MSTVVAKVTHDDGTEQSYGPVDVTAEQTEKIMGALLPLIEATEQRRAAELAERVERERVERDADALREQQQREELAAQGIDPDAQQPTEPEA